MESHEDLVIKSLAIRIGNLSIENARLLAALEAYQAMEEKRTQEGDDVDSVEDAVQD